MEYEARVFFETDTVDEGELLRALERVVRDVADAEANVTLLSLTP